MTKLATKMRTVAASRDRFITQFNKKAKELSHVFWVEPLRKDDLTAQLVSLSIQLNPDAITLQHVRGREAAKCAHLLERIKEQLALLDSDVLMRQACLAREIHACIALRLQISGGTWVRWLPVSELSGG